MKDDINKLIINVIDMVKDVPQEYQKGSFEVLLNYFLMQSASSPNTHMKKQTTKKQHSETNTLQVILNDNYDWASTGIKKLKGIMQYIKILNTVQNEFHIGALYASDIKTILEQKFRQKKTSNAISMSLMKSVGNYVNRIKENNGYKYKITASGKEKLQQIEGNEK